MDGGEVSVEGGVDLVSCGCNTQLGFLRENASAPLALVPVSPLGLLTIASPTSPPVTLRAVDVFHVVPMTTVTGVI